MYTTTQHKIEINWDNFKTKPMICDVFNSLKYVVFRCKQVGI